MKMKGKRFLSLLLTFIMLLGLLPTVALAAPDDIIELTVGETRTIPGTYDNGAFGHKWELSRNGDKIVTVVPKDYEADLTGKSEGTTTVTHTWYTKGFLDISWPQYEWWTVKVTKDPTVVRFYVQGTGTPLYNLTGVEDATGALINNDGKLKVEENFILYGKAPLYGVPLNGETLTEEWARTHAPKIEDIRTAINTAKEQYEWKDIDFDPDGYSGFEINPNFSDYSTGGEHAWHVHMKLIPKEICVTYHGEGGKYGEQETKEATWKYDSAGYPVESGAFDFVNPGYTFVKWTYNNAEAPNRIHTVNDIDLYAVWEENTNTITYQAIGGGTVSLGSEEVKTTGTPQGSTATPNEGYQFDGWYTTKTGGEAVSKDKEFVPTSVFEDVTYYARFSEKSEETKNAPVYVYAQIVGDEETPLSSAELEALNEKWGTRLQMNGDNGGWLTLGKIENFAGLDTAAANTNPYSYNLTSAAETETAMLANVKRQTDNIDWYQNGVNKIDPGRVTWKELHVVPNGAAGYDGVNYTWHLDGQIKVTALVNLEVEKTVASIVRGNETMYSADGGTAAVPAVKPGDEITWNITVSNSGCLPALIDKPTDTLTIGQDDSASTTPLTVTSDNDDANGQYTVPAADENGNGSISFTAEYKVLDTDWGKTLSNTAAVDDASGTNNDVKVEDKSTSTTYTLTYDANGGEGGPEAVSGLTAGTTYTLNKTNTPTHEAVDGKGVVFVGWKISPDDKIHTEAPSGLVPEVTIVGDTTVYAVWAEDKWTDSDPSKDENGDEPGDGIPDYKQVQVVYQAIPNTYGTVNKTSEVFTLADDQTSVNVIATASPTLSRAYFSSWTVSGTTFASGNSTTQPTLNTSIAVTGGNSYTITANFGYSGSGGSSSGSSGSSKPSTKPSTNLNTEEHFSYIIGYQDGTIRPYGTITRGEVATIFFRLLDDDVRNKYWSQTNGYSDCGPDLWCNNAISTLSSMGIIDGYTDGTFRPYAKITRAQFAKIAVGFFETSTKAYKGYFTDVPENAWFTDYVEAASRVGLIQGFEDGTFRPDTNITRAQACVIVNRALGRAPDEDHLLKPAKMITWPDNNPGDWYYADLQEATNSHDYTWVTVSGEKVENWTKKLEQRNWAAFEHAWSTAHSAPGGEVVK